MGKKNSDASSDLSPTPAQSLGLRLATESAFQLPLEGGKSSGGGKGPTGAEKSSALPPDWYVSQVPLDDNSHLKGKAQDKGKGKSNCDARHVTCYPRAGVSHVTLGRACHMVSRAKQSKGKKRKGKKSKRSKAEAMQIKV